MAERDVLGLQIASQGGAPGSDKDRFRRWAATTLILLARDIELFFRPARIPLIAHLLMASLLFVSIGTTGVLLAYAADIFDAQGMPPEMAMTLRYLSQLIIWLDVIAVSLLVVSAVARQVRDIARRLGA